MIPESVKCKCGLELKLYIREVYKDKEKDKEYYYEDNNLYLRLNKRNLRVSEVSLRDRENQSIVSKLSFTYNCYDCKLKIACFPTYLGNSFEIIILDDKYYIDISKSIDQEFINVYIDSLQSEVEINVDIDKFSLFELDKIFTKLDNILFLS